MRSLWVAIDSKCDETRVLATAGPRDTVLKARLSATAHHPRALPTLLEALALWLGIPVHAVVVAGGDPADSSATRLKLDFMADFGGSPLYTLEFVGGRKPRHRDLLDGMGPFQDLRQLLMFEVPK
jgi:hypothetical protein